MQLGKPREESVWRKVRQSVPPHAPGSAEKARMQFSSKENRKDRDTSLVLGTDSLCK